MDPFLSFLEYLYTDHYPIEDCDSFGVLMLANRYRVKRLSALCEAHISEHIIEQATSETIAQADVDVIGKQFLVSKSKRQT